jgi:amino acid adenylation domain-containing protein/non-ribosomal peptide synthase protein (TIGR01720 family)
MSSLLQKIAELSPEKRALLLQRLNQQKGKVSPAKIQPQSRDTQTFLLSFAQQRLWFFSQLEPESSAYNIPAVIRLTGRLNVAALENSINEIVTRHQILRTTFTVVNGEPVQVIGAATRLQLPIIDLQTIPETERETEVQRLATQEVQTPFNLETDSLLRISLLRLSQTDHVIFFTMHHIVSDGWSTGILIHELTTLYKADDSGQPYNLPELPIQYVDFAVWQRQWLQGEVLNTQLNYWKQKLGGDLPVLELPTNRPRPAIQTYRGTTQSFILSHSLTAALKNLSQQQEVTLFMTLLAAFKTLLYRYTGAVDILVGSPIANRNQLGLEGLIGFFVNTLVLRTDLSGNPTFVELLQRSREVALEAYDHQDLPFEKLVDELQLARNLSYTPLFQVMFTLQNTPNVSYSLPGLTMRPLEIEQQTANFDLSLTMEVAGEKLIGSIEYNTDLFDAATINRMVGHFSSLLESIIANPTEHIGNLTILTEKEQKQLQQWNYTQVEFRRDICIHQLFEEQVEKTPQAVAVIYDDAQLTYSQLNQKANQLAHYLQNLGVQPDQLIGICVERSLEMIVGILGILKAGGAYLPLDPSYPPERIAYMMADAEVSLLLTQEKLLANIPPYTGKIICLDNWQHIAQESQVNCHSQVTADNLAYVIYTSGSTGQAKGVMIEHQSLVNAYFAWEKDYKLHQIKTHLQMASFSFDVFAGDLVRALCSGGKLVLCPQDLLFSAQHLYALMCKKQVDSADFVPVVLRHLMQYLETSQQHLDFMRLLICGSDSWYGAEYRKFQSFIGSNTRLINAFGLTEATIDSSYFESATAELPEEQLVPIGRSFANTQMYILDANLQLVPVGVRGELYIGGAGLARGYLNRPELTAQRFISHPYHPGTRLYRTGDVVRYLPDGNIEFLGRSDYQVKIRGFRIELAEVEAAIFQHPQVKETTVVVREDTSGNQRLVAYVVAQEQNNDLIAALHQVLKNRLPNYMIPSAFVLLQALPLLPNGKLNRQALPEPNLTRSEIEETFVPPRTSVEKILAKIWAELLRLDHVGIYDNFFELGGDSILSIQAIARAKQAGLQLTTKQMFEHQAIAQLAAVAGTITQPEAEQGLVTGEVALTPIQHWFFEQNFPYPHHWNQSVLLEAQQQLDPQLLATAIQHLLKHHDALRLRYEQTEFGWRQFITSADNSQLFTHIDLSAVAEPLQAQAIETTATEIQASLNLCQGPLVRVALLELGSQKGQRLLVVIHHLAVDGVSWRILLEDLQTAYHQLSQGKLVKLPAKTTSFQQWARLLQDYAVSKTLQQELDHWLSLSSATVSPLPVDYPGGNNTVADSHTISVHLTAAETTALLTEVPATYNTQIIDVLLTALVRVLTPWMRSSTLLVNLEGHGREEIFNHVDLSRTVGWFTSEFPVLLSLEKVSQPPGDALKTIKEQLRRIPNRGIGYGILRYLHDPNIARQLQAIPSTQVSFNYLGQFDQVLSSSLLAATSETSGSAYHHQSQRSQLLDINGLIVGNKLCLDWTYSQSLYERTTIEKLAANFLQALQEIITHCQKADVGGYTPSDFPEVELSQTELDKVFAEMDFG